MTARFHQAVAIAFIGALCAPGARAGDEALRLTPDQYLAHIKYLAHDDRGGRAPGQPGIEQAAEYIAGQFRAAGLKPGGDDGTYFQTFTVESIKHLREAEARVEVSGLEREWKLHEDFRPFPFTATGAVAGPLAFAGYGIEAPEHGYNDYENFDAAGKVLLILRHEPKAADGEAKFGGASPSSHSLFVRKARVAHNHGAKALLIVNPPTRDEPDALYEFNVGESHGGYALPMIHITQAMADAILAHAQMPTLKELAEKLDAERKPLSQDLGGLTAKVNPGVEPVQTRNVIGILPGRSDEYVVAGAHYDHVGISRPFRGVGLPGRCQPPFPPKRSGKHHPRRGISPRDRRVRHRGSGPVRHVRQADGDRAKAPGGSPAGSAPAGGRNRSNPRYRPPASAGRHRRTHRWPTPASPRKAGGV